MSNLWTRMFRADALCDQGHRCCWCLGKLTREDATVEHLEPRVAGGRDRRENIAAAHRRCNRARGSIPAKQFKKMLNGSQPAPHLEIAVIASIRRIHRRADLACKRIRAVAA